jgi:hypothetical protein
MPKSLKLLALVSTAAALLTGCPDDEVTHNRVAKEEPAAAPAMPPMMGKGPMGQMPPGAPMAAPGAPAVPSDPMMPGGSMMKGGDVPVPPKPTGSEGVSWTLPKGWTQTLSGGIRYATLKPAGAGNIDSSVVVLPGEAGGELPNVNRWRGQLGLPPADAATLPTLRKVVNTKAGPVALYDFSSEGAQKTRMVAGLAMVNGSSWFFKMTGDATAVGAALPDFSKLIESLQPGANAN